LQNRDDWLAQQPAEDRRNWFQRTSSWLAKLNEEAARRARGTAPKRKGVAIGSPEDRAAAARWEESV
jgi:hypothetical protein